ncbi:unnamed protein product, partial [Linum tenue]
LKKPFLFPLSLRSVSSPLSLLHRSWPPFPVLLMSSSSHFEAKIKKATKSRHLRFYILIFRFLGLNSAMPNIIP